MWDLPRPGLEPVSPALAGRFSTTAPPGKPLKLSVFVGLFVCLFVNNSSQNGSSDGSSSGSFLFVLFGGLGDGKWGTEETLYNIAYL